MQIRKIIPKSITCAGFSRYGRVIEYPERPKASGNKNLFKVIVRQPDHGWRIAYLVVRERSIDRLEQHPDSLESFEPVSGRGLIYLSTRKDLRRVECFYLDKPVILKKGIWHGVVALSADFDVKITENSKVKCIYWRL